MWELLFSGPLPRKLDDLERVLGVYFFAAKVELGHLELRDPSEAISSVTVAFDIGWMSNPTTAEGYRLWDLRWCAVSFTGSYAAAEAALVKHHGPAVRVTDERGHAWDRYGEFLVRSPTTTAAWNVWWYDKLPDWAVTGVDPASRRVALRRLAEGDQLEPFAPETGIHVLESTHDRLELELHPAVSGLELASWLELGAVFGYASFHREDGGPDCWIEQIVSDDGTQLVHRKPQLGDWILDARLERVATGRRISGLHAAELTAGDLVRYIGLQRGEARTRELERIHFGFVSGDEAEAILDLGRQCITGRSLPDAVFGPQLVRFCWRTFEPVKLWEFVTSVASAMSDRVIYSVAPSAWLEAGVGVFQIDSHVGRPVDFAELVEARSAHGPPPIQWLFGRSGAWAAALDHDADLIVVGVSRPYYHFEGACGYADGLIKFADVLQRLPHAGALRQHYGAGSIFD